MHQSRRPWQPVTGDRLPPPAGFYSSAIRAGELLFVSGQVPKDPATGALVGGGIESESRRTLQNLDLVLEAAGATLADVVAVTVYLADENDWGAFNAVFGSVFAPPYPTRTVVGASLRGMLVEVTATAYLGGR